MIGGAEGVCCHAVVSGRVVQFGAVELSLRRAKGTRGGRDRRRRSISGGDNGPVSWPVGGKEAEMMRTSGQWRLDN